MKPRKVQNSSVQERDEAHLKKKNLALPRYKERKTDDVHVSNTSGSQREKAKNKKRRRKRDNENKKKGKMRILRKNCSTETTKYLYQPFVYKS